LAASIGRVPLPAKTRRGFHLGAHKGIFPRVAQRLQNPLSLITQTLRVRSRSRSSPKVANESSALKIEGLPGLVCHVKNADAKRLKCFNNFLTQNAQSFRRVPPVTRNALALREQVTSKLAMV